MADRPTVRDDDRLPWLDSVEGERTRPRKPVSRTALVGLLVAFLGVGLAVAFSLGYRLARPAAEPTVAVRAPQPQRTASVQVPLAPPAPQVEPAAPPAVVEPPAAERKPAVRAKPALKKAGAAHHKARPRHVRHRKPILRPFINVKRHSAARAPVRYLQPVPVGPRGRLVQLGAYSTVRQADNAYRTIVWRYPYLGKKPKVLVATPPVGGHQYYRLQLVTDSQAQSAVICQYLQARRQSCIVLY
jgi:hypothetical protein